MSPRAEHRKDFDLPVRTALLESDMDEFESVLLSMREELSGIRKVLIGLLVSITTACLLLAINITVVGGGGH